MPHTQASLVQGGDPQPSQVQGGDRHADRITPLEQLFIQFDQLLDAHVTAHRGEETPLAFKAQVAKAAIDHFDKIRMKHS